MEENKMNPREVWCKNQNSVLL